MDIHFVRNYIICVENNLYYSLCNKFINVIQIKEKPEIFGNIKWVFINQNPAMIVPETLENLGVPIFSKILSQDLKDSVDWIQPTHPSQFVKQLRVIQNLS